ncbi:MULTISPECIES: hypothetical protein [unclassified Paenibacillus]|uniref:hypothetical protein n=1 Tax=unclassified Paenibacillus TaxID=185978 RepID=UPI0003E2BD68|nr:MULTISPECIES: hypothetical protein [unclassified Paenibacillus]ETT56703.1 hypothetical protein C162_00753 [Paenibacillus sp. FSL R7-269]OMG00350.1 hypothetical protein BK147_03830 [Paenibacillus sp. FSL R7-0337]
MDNPNDEPKVDRSARRKVILRPRSRVDYPRRDRSHNEEYAAELSPLPSQLQSTMERSGEAQRTTGGVSEGEDKRIGYIGLGFGVVSLFIWSIILGPIAAVLGYYAYARGQKSAGAWSMGLGIVSTLSYFVLIPFAR